MSVIIRKMTDEEFDIFCQWSIENHARELIQEEHLPQEETLAEAKREVAGMLPDGIRTEHHYLMTIAEENSREAVGFIWMIHEETGGKKQNFLCDFVIKEPFRRNGYGTAALRAMEKHAAEAGCQESVLFVADRNKAAGALYEKCGYRFLKHAGYGRYMIKKL